MKIDFSVNFSTIDVFQYEYAEFMSNLGVRQSHRGLRCKGVAKFWDSGGTFSQRVTTKFNRWEVISEKLFLSRDNWHMVSQDIIIFC